MTLAELSPPRIEPKIYKYSFGSLCRGIHVAEINGPALMNILDIQEQGNDLVLWAEVDTAQMGARQAVKIFAAYTGDPPPGHAWTYFKTIQSWEYLVYHIYIHK